jgi:hypothetical protein
MVIAPGCREAAAAAAKYVGEVEKRIYWIVAGDGGGGIGHVTLPPTTTFHPVAVVMVL